MKNFNGISENICTAWVGKGEIGLKIIVVHVPSDSRMPKTFAELSNVLLKIPPEDCYIILGDFNGHIGYNDITEDVQHLLGKQLLHKESNENGLFLLQLALQFNLAVSSSFARSRSVIETWSNRKISSQTDHILLPI